MHSAVPFNTFEDTYDITTGFVGLNNIYVYRPGSWADYLFSGTDGNNTIYGGHGDDVAYGEGGNDTVSGGYGYNELFGDDGIDTLNYEDFGLNSSYRPPVGGLGVEVDLDTGLTRDGLAMSTAKSLNGNLLLRDEAYSFENVTGSSFADTVYGNALSNDFEGGNGNDILSGAGGSDFIEGGEGSDDIYGGSGDDDLLGDIISNGTVGGDDYISAGNGNDYVNGGRGYDDIYGGIGSDSLYGGTQGDRFGYRSIAESTTALSGRDVIRDFIKGSDYIDLTAIDANGLTSGTNNVFDLIFTDTFNNVAGELRYRLGANGAQFTVIEGDTNGNGIADFAITVLGRHFFAFGDFEL